MLRAWLDYTRDWSSYFVCNAFFHLNSHLKLKYGGKTHDSNWLRLGVQQGSQPFSSHQSRRSLLEARSAEVQLEPDGCVTCKTRTLSAHHIYFYMCMRMCNLFWCFCFNFYTIDNRNITQLNLSYLHPDGNILKKNDFVKII